MVRQNREQQIVRDNNWQEQDGKQDTLIQKISILIIKPVHKPAHCDTQLVLIN